MQSHQKKCKTLYSTFGETNQPVLGDLASSGVRYATRSAAPAPKPRVFFDVNFYHDKIRCLVDDATREDRARAVEMNKLWRQKVAAAAAASAAPVTAADQGAAAVALPPPSASVRLVFELDTDNCPRASLNVLKLVTDGGLSETVVGREPATASRITGPACLKGTYLHKLLPGFVVAGGDVCSSSGLNNVKSSLQTGRWFADEALDLPMDERGLLGIVNNGPNSNGTQWFITLGDGARAKLDARHVCVGRVVEGFDAFEAQLRRVLISGDAVIASCAVVADCGLVE
jgi:cyclophilin family peptidyl-prolyl cis-trans isomerase